MRERCGRRGKTAGGGVVDSAGEELEVGGDLTSGVGLSTARERKREGRRSRPRVGAGPAVQFGSRGEQRAERRMMGRRERRRGN
jgi:hypothetical protein